MDRARPPRTPRALARGLFALAALTAGCSAPPPVQPPPGETVRSDHARITAPAVSADDQARLVRGNTEFAARMYQQTAAREAGNLVFSPYSVSIALAMTWAGARGETAQQMADALRFGLPQDRLHPAFNALDQVLASRASTAPVDRGGRPFRLRVVSALFGQRGYRFLTPFLDTLAENYGAGLSLLDFAQAPDAARVQINQWVADQTEQRIPELLAQGVITAATTLVLADAVYFNASWDRRFDPALTLPGPFHRTDGTTAVVPSMHQVADVRYAEGEGYQAVELPYLGAQVAMLVIVPTAGQLGAFEAGLDADRLDAVAGALHDRRVTLSLPRFRARTALGLRATLQSLGMRAAFNGGEADFSGMDGTRALFVQDVVHQGWIDVDESGTEAAAATAVIVGRVSVPEPATLVVDRPFLFAIRDVPTGAVLFLGRVADPSVN